MDCIFLYLGQGQDGTDEAVFVEIFGTRSWSHLDLIFNFYLARYNYPLESVIRAEFSDAIHDSFMNICMQYVFFYCQLTSIF